ncbi:hypothetical protein J2046_005798 [Rhizobium petrolearium]|nr:hypothetical protein [Neorhizobium petrolearium]
MMYVVRRSLNYKSSLKIARTKWRAERVGVVQ